MDRPLLPQEEATLIEAQFAKMIRRPPFEPLYDAQKLGPAELGGKFAGGSLLKQHVLPIRASRAPHKGIHGRGLHGSKQTQKMVQNGFVHASSTDTIRGPTDFFDRFSVTSVRNHPQMQLSPRSAEMQRSLNRGGEVFSKYMQHCINKDVHFHSTGHFGCDSHDLGVGWK